MSRTSADQPPADVAAGTRSVLAILVVRDGAPWLKDCLQALARQRHRRLGVVAVDAGSVDGSAELLERALGAERVLRTEPGRGVPTAIAAAMAVPAAQEADYLLVLHDDAVLSERAVERMLEVATQVERVGIVGAKVVDWDDPRILREVGRATDRFGHAHSPLEDGEMDHGQYDRIREVLFVSSPAMLISRAAWERAGLPDERLGPHHDDMDFCWRVRLAGYRVLVTPLAQVRHRAAGLRGERPERHRAVDSRYYRERAALATMLKTYRLVTLAWLLPVYVLEGLAKAVFFVVTRRLDGVSQLLAAWGWNLVRIPGTLRRRIRAQSVRAVPDRVVRRFMTPTGERLRKTLESVDEALLERRGERELDEEGRPLRARATSLARAHPVAVASVLAVGVGFLATRHLVGPHVLQGAALPVFPEAPSAFFRELASGYRSTGLGGTQPASAALALLGTLSTLAFGSTALAQKVVLAAGPPLAAMAVYRTVTRTTGQRAAGVLAGGCYALSAIVLWAYSEGRIELLGAAVALPLVTGGIDAAFAGERPRSLIRFAVGTGMALAVGVSFEPGLLLPLALFAAVHVLTAGRRLVTGVVRTASAVAAGLLLALPTLLGLLRDPAAALGSTLGAPSFGELARLALGPGPGSWALAWFLPAAAVVGLSVAGRDVRGRANRTALAGGLAIVLAWGSAAGYLPPAFSNAPAYVLLAALAQVRLVGYGVASLLPGIERQTFGYRHIAAAVLAALLLGGLTLQVLRVSIGDWGVGKDRLPAAWPIVGSAGGDPFRVLWLGHASGSPFPAPGGDPRGIVDAGSASVRYGITDRSGTTALDVGRGQQGPGYGYVEASLGEILSGTTRHGGALLAPLGVRFLVAAEGDVAPVVIGRLERQVDLDRVSAGGLVIYENARAEPAAALLVGEDVDRAARSTSLLEIAAASPVEVVRIPEMPGGWAGDAEGSGVVRIGDQYDEDWRLESGGGSEAPFRAAGWALGFEAPPGAFTVVFTRQWVRSAEMALLAALWLVAFWVTRRPAS